MEMPSALIEVVRNARRVVVLTGAGVSAESGIPTFRDAQTGLWARYDPEELASPRAFKRNPKLVWQWYQWRRDLCAGSTPNPGHFALVEMERRIPEFTLVTQNVDGLHALAGSRQLLELHGNIGRYICYDRRHPVTGWEPTDELPPRCPICHSLVRPDVVWFGEQLDAATINRAAAVAERCDVFFSIGTSSIVYPAALLPQLALEHGAVFVEVNPNPTPLTRFADFVLQAPSGVALPALVQTVWPEVDSGS
ncbi:MAG: NAD-dependent deacylase [Anaerolineae bacterium]|nr:NAD-dependent deacylase [Anaerolineae bacterium]MCO5198412.1 NAD-dependent deacylase [Anaerolineae bacterium]MCO5207825.1 NAD-dependent deacylase [Anaerolineae bacterium]